MPCLHYSNQLESLIVPLAHELDKRDPFDTTEIVVPNFSLEKWISLKLAQISGIAANLRFITLEKAINEGLQKKLSERHYSLLKPETIQCLLLGILREKVESSDPLWIPVRSYLTPQTFLNQQAREHRIYQFAGRLTRLFMEYEFSRYDELLTSWLAGQNAIDQDLLGVESWQRALWTELFGQEGILTRYNLKARRSLTEDFQPELFSLSQIYRICQDKVNHQTGLTIENTKPEKDPLHVFGISYLSQFHQKALTEQLSFVRDIHVYTLNPCMEFWEDVQSLGESKAYNLRTLAAEKPHFKKQKYLTEKEIALGELLQNEEDNPFLKAWGRPGRENIRLLNQWTDWNFNPWFKKTGSSPENTEGMENQKKNVLNQLQEDILLREPRRIKSLELDQDDSLMILACANPRREVEAVASLIWDWIRLDSNLCFNECAVIVHDMERYQNEIEQVFESIYKLPYHLIDGVSGSAGRLEEAAEALLSLCFTEYTRRDIFALIKNPCFLGKFEDKIPSGGSQFGEALQIEQWLEWADELNIFYGVDKEFQEGQGYLHLEQDIYHWEQAFRRLTLADMLTTHSETGMFSIAGKKIAPANLPDEWSEEAARFMLVLRSLIADTRDLPKWEMSGKEWGEYLRILFTTYLKPIEPADEEAFQNLLRNVQTASYLDFAQEYGSSFSFSTIHQFFKQKIQSSTLQRGHYLAEGVTVSSFQPMRPIPFKAVFLLGLGEGMFPTPYQHDTLDLRHIPVKLSPAVEGHNFRERCLGDVSVTERDRYMFLETLVSTKKHLVLSYVSRNDRTDDEINPSSIIQTLVEELNRGYLKTNFQHIKHPLKPYSLCYFPELTDTKSKSLAHKHQLPNYDPAAFRQARAFRTRELLNHELLGTDQSIAFQRISPDCFSPEVKQILNENDFLHFAPEDSAKSNLNPVSFTHLRKFLESPLQSTASHLLGLSEDEGERDGKIDEPFLLERLSEWSLLRKVWDCALTLPENNHHSSMEPVWEELYCLHAQRMELEGNMPSGIFGRAMQSRHLRILNIWQKQICTVLKIDWSVLKKNLRQYHLGPIQEGTFYDGLNNSHKFFPALCISNENSSKSGATKNRTKFYGKTEWWYADESENWHVIYLSENESRDKSWLRHFLDVLILRSANLLPENAKVKGLCIGGEGKIKSKTINIPVQQCARTYLFDILQEMNAEDAAVLMPIESVLEIAKENLNATSYNRRFKQWMDNKLNSPMKNKGISSQYGPVKYIKDIPYPKNPYQLMNRRFGLFFETFSA